MSWWRKKPTCKHCNHWDDALVAIPCETTGELQFPKIKRVECCKCHRVKHAYSTYTLSDPE